MKIPLTYGLGVAVALSVLSLGAHVAGISTNPDRMFLGIAIGLIGFLVICTTGLILGLRAARAEQGVAGFTYGQAFKTGLLISLFAGLGSFVFSLVYFGFIFPDFAEVQGEGMRNFMERMNVPADKIDAALEDARAKATVLRQAFNGFVFQFIVGLFLSLILAAILKRAPTEDVTQPPSLA